MMEDASFDRLADDGGSPDPEAAANAADAESRAHVALFEHVGVTDPEDWQTVALRLACRYAPDLLKGIQPCSPALPAKKVGRPEKWDDWRLTMLLAFVEIVKEESRKGGIRHDLKTNAAVCRFIAGPYPETQWIRDALGLKPGTSPGRLDNLRRDALRLSKPAPTHANV